MRTHIKNIVIFFHPMSGIQVASGKFSTATGEAEVIRRESEVSFLQVKATMSLKERIRQVKAEICDNRRQIAHVSLESLAGAENPYSVPRVQVKRRPSAAGLLPAPTQMALCLRLAYIDFKRRELTTRLRNPR